MIMKLLIQPLDEKLFVVDDKRQLHLHKVYSSSNKVDRFLSKFLG